MYRKKKLIHISGCLTLLSVGIFPIAALADNCTEAPVDGQVYSLINAGSGQALDVYGARTTNAANVIQWPYHEGANQQFLLSELGDGYWSLKAEHSGMAVDVDGKRMVGTANIHQHEYRGAENQQWQLVRSSNGAYALVARHSGLAMTTTDDKLGGNVYQLKDSGSENQLWYLNPIDGSCGTSEQTPVPTSNPTDEPAFDPVPGATLEPWPETTPTEAPTVTPTEETKSDPAIHPNTIEKI
jgi:hypothetical protein